MTANRLGPMSCEKSMYFRSVQLARTQKVDKPVTEEPVLRTWLITVGILIVALLPVKIVDGQWLVASTLDALHFPGGILLWWILPRLLDSVGMKATSALQRLAIAALLIVGLEVLQTLTGRTASLNDAIYGASGVAVAWLAAVIGRINRGLNRRAVRALVLLVPALVVLLPVAYDWALLSRMSLIAPIISDLEWPGEARVWQPEWGTQSHVPKIEVVRVPSDGSRSLKVEVREGGWSGASIHVVRSPVPTSGISFQVANPADRFLLHVQCAFRSSDGKLTKVDTVWEIGPGQGTVLVDRLPEQKAASWRDLESILIFVRKDAGSRAFYLDNLRRF